MKKSIHTARAALLFCTLAFLSCERADPPAGISFRMADIPMEPSMTRSLLDAPDIETKVTGITLAAYSDGYLAASSFFTGGFDAMSLDLDPSGEYSVYALVNMGNRTADLPDAESGMETLSYRIPSYTAGEDALNVRGLPMSGRLSYDGRTAVIPVKRLLARVTAIVSCGWKGAAIRSAKVFNLNRLLLPFGTGTAASADEILDGQEYQEGTGTDTGTFVFYVPENLQGTISGIASPSGKSPDLSPEVQARSKTLTYLETVVEGTGVYTGSITYRSYLGSDAVSNFDICRNASYQWNLRFLPEGLQDSGWKRDNQLTDTRFLRWKDHPEESSVHVYLQVGEEGTRAGETWRPEPLLWGDSTGEYRIQGEAMDGTGFLDNIGYTVDRQRFQPGSAERDGLPFTILDGDLPTGDYEARFYFLDRPDASLSAWLHVQPAVTVIRELSLEPAQAVLVTGYTKTYGAYLTERTLRNGVEESRTTTHLAGSELEWVSADTGKAVVCEGAVTGVSPGTVLITATLKSDPAIRATATLTVTEGTGGIDHGWDDGDEQILN